MLVYPPGRNDYSNIRKVRVKCDRFTAYRGMGKPLNLHVLS